MEYKETVPLPCAEKQAFDTKAAAEAAKVTAKWRYGGKFKSYKCRHCRLWHLASDYGC